MKKTAISKQNKKSDPFATNRVVITPIELDLIDPQTVRQVNGRLLLGVHEATGLVAGFQFADPGTDPAGVVRCLKNCLLPKQRLLTELDLKGDWSVSGLFDACNVPASLVGDLEPVLSRLFRNYHVRLELRSDSDPLSITVDSTLQCVARRMHEAFCLDKREIEEFPMLLPNLWRRAAKHAFSYRPGRGFLEQIASPPEWDLHCEIHPPKPVDEYLEEHIRRDFDQLAGTCFICQCPAPSLCSASSI